jgi:hypothetical protein
VTDARHQRPEGRQLLCVGERGVEAGDLSAPTSAQIHPVDERRERPRVVASDDHGLVRASREGGERF